MSVKRRKNRNGRVIGWQAVLKRTDPVTGKKVERVIGTYPTKREADAAEREAVRDFEQGRHIDPSTVTVAEWIKRWLATKESTVSKNTVLDYESAFRLHINPVLGDVRMQALTTTTVQDTYDAWSRKDENGNPKLHPRMVHRCHLVLNQACAMSVRMGIIHANPCADVELPRMERQEMRVWDAHEVRAFLEAADEHSYRIAWYLMVLEGLRRGEALGVRWRDYNRDAGVLHLVQSVTVDKESGATVVLPRTKTSAGSRTVRLTERTKAALETTARKGDLITCTDAGGPINPNNISRAFKMLVLRAGVQEIRVHDMRHTAASLLLRAGVGHKIVQERLGHASSQTTMDIYAHLIGDMQQSAAMAMDALLDEKKPRTDE